MSAFMIFVGSAAPVTRWLSGPCWALERPAAAVREAEEAG